MNQSDVVRRFEYHPPSTDEVRQTHEAIRDRCLSLALYLFRTLPDCDEKDEAIRRVDEACMFANATVARTQLVSSPPPARSETIG